MGRGKLRMELIENEKSRFLTYRKRLKGLMKKAYEFTTLCGVKACLIIYGPKIKGDSESTLTIWPSDGSEVKAVIEKYRAVTVASGVKGKKAFDLVDYFAVRQRMVNEEITKVQKANSEAKFPSWDNGIKNLNLDQIKGLVPKFDSKIEAANMEIKARKMRAAERDNFRFLPNLQNNLDFNVLKHEFSTQLVPYQPYGQATIPNQQFLFDINPVETPMLALLQGEQNSGASSNDSTIAYNGTNPVFAGSRYQEIPTTAGWFDSNELMNNHWVVPVQFYQPPPLPVQYQALQSMPVQFETWIGQNNCVGMK